MLRALINWFHVLLYHPMRVFWICVSLSILGVVLDGTALRLWSLHREYHVLSSRIEDARTRSKQLDFKIHQAQSSEFIERAARDQFDLVKEGDLIFVFSDDGPIDSEKTTE